MNRMQKAKTNIYETTDYNLFVFPEWNRDVSNARVVKMIESINTVGWLEQPVLVNEKYEVIDGQSRVKALEKMGLPVQFIIKPGIGRKECQNLNRFQKNWSTMNYIDSYAFDGNDNYVWLKNMLKEYRDLTSAVVFTVAVSGGTSHAIGAAEYYQIIEKGEVDVSGEKRKAAEAAMFYLSRFVETVRYLGGRKDKFFSAIMFLYLLDTIDNERLYKTVNNARFDRLVSSSTVEGYLRQFDSLYNKGLAKIKRIDVEHEYRVS